MDGGTATYKYYENADYERIYEGPFTFKNNYSSAAGTFKKNKKVGKWKFTRTGTMGHAYLTSITDVNYVGGKLNGVCIYTVVDKSNEIYLKSVANFKNNVQVGTYSYDDSGKMYSSREGTHIKANFTQNGFLDGTCTTKFTIDKKDYVDIIKCRNGIIVSRLYRDVTDGDVIQNVKDAVKDDSINTNYLRNYNNSTGASFILNFSFVQKHPDRFKLLDETSKEELNYSRARGKYSKLTLSHIPKELNYQRDFRYPQPPLELLDFTHNNGMLQCEDSSARNRSVGEGSNYCRGVENITFKPIKEIVGLVGPQSSVD